ncbi:MAG TPA: hypothetical protein VI685_01965 [Candidatus Angelobacter sp.]
MTFFRIATAALLLIALGGCMHSHVIQVTVTNASNEKISNVVIDYPDATFGINSLEPGKSFQYKIKPTGSGALKIEFLNSHAVDHVSAGPVVHKNDEGSIEIKVTQDGAVAEASLNPA